MRSAVGQPLALWLRGRTVAGAARAERIARGVFTDDFIDAYIAVKMQEVTRYRASTHPLEFQMYYAL
ncbi:hypothetical protein IHE49_14750 [Rhodanobacter sp. 7MK24]|nr:hypothetical protein [Rhodanobacter sp. 7MK24]